jgi:hypothetical protein
MSRRELVDAYVSGAINRRTFVRGLTADGLAARVAASYAVALRPTAARKRTGNDFYDDGEARPDLRDDGKNGEFAQVDGTN